LPPGESCGVAARWSLSWMLVEMRLRIQAINIKEAKFTADPSNFFFLHPAPSPPRVRFFHGSTGSRKAKEGFLALASATSSYLMVLRLLLLAFARLSLANA
jgi:hypothetical protein